jgi:DUF1680 family protein
VALFNEFRYNQFLTGDFGHHGMNDVGLGLPYARAWWCCTFHGLRAMAALYGFAFREKDGALLYDLPVDARGRAAGWRVRAEATLERNERVALRVEEADAVPHTLAVRLPEWASRVSFTMGEKPVASKMVDGYAQVTRVWRKDETLTARYTMRARVVAHARMKDRAAVFYGPWLLAVDEAGSPNYFDEPSRANRVELEVVNGEPKLKPVARAAAPAKFTVPVAHFTLRYKPGGYPVQPQAATLKPIAEFTAGPDNNVLEYWLPVGALNAPGR